MPGLQASVTAAPASAQPPEMGDVKVHIAGEDAQVPDISPKWGVSGGGLDFTPRLCESTGTVLPTTPCCPLETRSLLA